MLSGDPVRLPEDGRVVTRPGEGVPQRRWAAHDAHTSGADHLERHVGVEMVDEDHTGPRRESWVKHRVQTEHVT